MVYGEAVEGPLPVLYVLDGGGEDLLHIAGLVQVLVSNGGCGRTWWWGSRTRSVGGT